MIVLRISQSALGAGEHRVAVRLNRGSTPMEAVSDFTFRLSAADRGDVRWYLEDYLQYPQEAAPQVAARVEERLAELGTELFELVFGQDDARDIWSYVRSRLSRVRVEISSDVAGAAILPWELLRDPRTGLTTALQVDSFVRVNDASATSARPSSGSGAMLRVLLVICRPEAANDVPFRSVAGYLVRLRGLSSDAFLLDVLRPPTFARLAAVLEAAREAERPYHAVHFDGHGTYIDVSAHGIGEGTLLSPARPGPHGYVLFEEPANQDNVLLVDGPALGSLLARTGVSVLVLNACRSAYDEEPDEPSFGFATMYTGVNVVLKFPQQHILVSDYIGRPVPAYGSLALEVTNAGVAGVIAMRYSVYVVTAAQFVADLYDALLAGQPLGAAATTGRRQLAAQPSRTIGFEPRPLQDWSVPVVYEAEPLSLFGPETMIRSGADGDAAGRQTHLVGFPQRTDAGFFGRDETLLALDRAFDTYSVVLLQGWAGSGKTATATEFAHWYVDTGGLDTPSAGVVPALFTSLEVYTPVRRILDGFGEVFHALLVAKGVDWQILDDAERRRVALETMATVPVLWIWDSVEAVTGFPPGADSPWSEAEQHDLLRDVATTRAKMLLTSRRGEQAWLGDLPVRIHLPTMPMRECIQLTEALSTRYGHHIDDMGQWRSLLGYTAGNPLTVRVLVRQALLEGLTDREHIESFVTRLQRGEATMADDMTQGRTESLGASMDYGFEGAFTRHERAQLAVLHLFQGSVDIAALTGIGDPGNVASLPELAELNRPAALALLDRATEAGLLSKAADGRYILHPAIPWYLGRLYAETYGPRERHDRIVLNAFTAAIARLGRQHARLYRSGHADVATYLAAEEANLLNARVVAARGGRWQEVMGCMHGLRVLYRHVGRSAEWAVLVRELLAEPVIAGLADDNVNDWRQLLDFQVELARDRRDWDQAEWLIRTVIDRDRDRAANALAADPERLTHVERDSLRWLAAGLVAVGHIIRERRSPDCLSYYHEAAELYRRVGDTHEERGMASNLGDAYVGVPDIRDLSEAERCYWVHLQSLENHDRLGHAKVIAQLGRVAHERFLDGRRADRPKAELLHHLKEAADATSEAVGLTPPEARNVHAFLCDALGVITADAGMVDVALTHYREALRVYDDTDGYQAGRTRLNVARTLAQGDRIHDALMYTRTAVRDFESEGAANILEIEEARRLIRDLEQGRVSREDPDDGPAGVLASL